jgi:hypothetical protein
MAVCVVAGALVGCGGSSATSAPSAPSGSISGPGFSATGSMTTARMGHTATLLPNGRVLIAGGYSGEGPDHLTYFASAELYDPATGTFSGTGSMKTARAGATATLLPNGAVLIAGGYFIDATGATVALASAELYDPTTAVFTPAGSMSSARYNHTATLLTDGRVMLAGGTGSSASLSSVELYEPGTSAFSSGGSMTTARTGHTATSLATGWILLAGGARTDQPGSPVYLASTELYDPATGTSMAGGSMAAVRYTHTATLLPNGRVLIAGGLAIVGGGSKGSLASAELYDPGAATFTPTGSMAAARSGHLAVILANGLVLVAGGLGLSGSGAASNPTAAELYDPAGGAFSVVGTTTGRSGATGTLLANGLVLIAGGGNTSGILASAELYRP